MEGAMSCRICLMLCAERLLAAAKEAKHWRRQLKIPL